MNSSNYTSVELLSSLMVKIKRDRGYIITQKMDGHNVNLNGIGLILSFTESQFRDDVFLKVLGTRLQRVPQKYLENS